MMRQIFFLSLIFAVINTNAQTISARLPGSFLATKNAVNNADVPPSEAGNDISLCKGGQAQIGTVSNPNYNYSWSPSTGLSSTSVSNPIVSNVNNDSITIYRKYYVTTSTSPSDSSRDSISVAFNPKPIAGKDTTVCKGSVINLKANPALGYQWTPSTGLSSTTVQNPECIVNSSQTYYLTATNLANNLLSNGDFERDTSGFKSGYIYCNTFDCLGSYTSDGYSVGTSAKFFERDFIGHDHTTGNGKFMIINGAVQGLSVWKQTVNVTHNTTYSLSCWVSSLVNFRTAQIRFSINGSQIGSIYNAPADTSIWNQYYNTWFSGSSNTATIEIVDVFDQSDGNDFGLDDIFFGPISSCTDSIHIQSFSSITRNSAATICSGKADTLPSGKIVFNAGDYSDTLKNSFGCDSLISNLTLQVINADIKNISAAICSGQPYTLPSGRTVLISGVYSDTLKSRAGCDSSITNVTLNVLTPERIDTSISICFGHPYFLPSGRQISLPGTYIDTIRNNKGCDSLITTVHLTVIYSTSVTKSISICQGQAYTLPSGAMVKNTATYTDTLKNTLGCDSLITTVNLTVFSPTRPAKSVSICKGQTYIMPSGSIINTSGIYTDTLKNIAGCDSLITTVNLTVNTPVVLPVSNVTICPGQTFTLLSGIKVSTAGVHKDTLKSAQGCDSLITTINLSVLSPTSATKNISICQGQSYTLPSGKAFNTTGIYEDTLKSTQGCDSLITTLNLTVISPTLVIKNDSICSGQFYTLPSGIHVTAAGIYHDTLKNTFGCDSLVITTNLAVTFNGVFVSKTVAICLGQSYTMPSGIILNATGVYTDTLKNVTGCDSVITTINLTVVSPILVSKNVSICSGESYTMPSGLVISITGVYKDTLKSTAGCDSLVTMVNLIVNVSTASNNTVSTCLGQSYTLPSGLAVNTPGMYKSIIKNVNGCDSVITTTVENKPPLTVGVSGPSSICAGDEASIVAQVSGGNGGPYTYAWSGSGVTNNQLIIFPTADTKIMVIVSDGCTAPVKDSITILVKPKPTANFSITSSAGCVPLTVNLTNSSSPLSNNLYTWYFGDNSTDTQINPSHIYTTPGNYDILLIATNTDGCSDSFKIINAAKVITPPVAAFTTSPSPNIFANSKIDFIDRSTGATSWLWIFGDGIGSSVQRYPTYIYQDSGTYKARLIVTNGSNCSDTAYSDIDIRGGDQIYIPDAFTPNGDNINDNFRILGIGLISVDMVIYNNWGQKVFQQAGISPSWNGRDQRNEKDCDQGVFVYVIKAINKTGKVQSFKGIVTLIR